MVKVLVSPPTELGFAGHSHALDEFTWTEPGEMVLTFGCPCDSPDCERALIGVKTRRGTTRALVAELALTADEVAGVAEASQARAWSGYLRSSRAHARDAVEWVLREAARFEVGAVVRKEGDGLVLASRESVQEADARMWREIGAG